MGKGEGGGGWQKGDVQAVLMPSTSLSETVRSTDLSVSLAESMVDF